MCGTWREKKNIKEGQGNIYSREDDRGDRIRNDTVREKVGVTVKKDGKKYV